MRRISLSLGEADLELLASAARRYALTVPAYIKMVTFKQARSELGAPKPVAKPAPKPAATREDAALFAKWDAEGGT